jgi:hypothetical protein
MSDDMRSKWSAEHTAADPDDVYARIEQVDLSATTDGNVAEPGGDPGAPSVTRRGLIARSLRAAGAAYVGMKVLETFTGHQIVGTMPLHAASAAVQLD